MSTSTIAFPADEIAAWRHSHPRLFAAPFAQRWRTRAIVLALAALLGFGLWWIDASPTRIWSGLSRLGFLLRLMMPPATGGALGIYVQALLETLAMAFFGTFLAAVAAFPLGFLAARNIVPNWIFHFTFRRLLDGFRGVDILIWALIFVSAVGMGPFAGVLALAFSDVAFLTKIYAEAIENVDVKPIEGARAAGANWIQIIRLAVVPQVMPIILGNAIYFFESNIRAATVLGIVGAGGIGMQLSQRILINNWDQACFIILMMLATVAIIDFLSQRVRTRIIWGQPSGGPPPRNARTETDKRGKTIMTPETSKRLGEIASVHPTAVVKASSLGRYVDIGEHVRLTEVAIGDYSYIARDADAIYADIGKFCSIAAATRINPGNHPMWRATQHHFTYRSAQYDLGAEDDAPFFQWRRDGHVSIGHDVWLGHGAVILAGVTIGTGAVVAAGAVVSKSVAPYTVVGGVPAKPIKQRLPPALAEKLIDIAWWDWSHDRLRQALVDFRALSIEAFVEKYDGARDTGD